jgi:hypothetical protein
MDEPFRPVPTADRYSTASCVRHAPPRGLRRLRLRTGWLASACWLACATDAPARAHEAPAEPPQFFADDCITVVDSDEQGALDIAYAVAFDDTVLTQGDIPVDDAKTHQFFAFRGMLFPQGFGHELFAFDPELPDAITLPLWITSDDVKRAAQANGAGSGTTFSESDVPADTLLEKHPRLQGRWLRVTADDARVPITIAQSLHGVHWELAGVPPGLYTVAGYIFSPPYNGWAVRPGLVAIVAGGEPVLAAVLEPVHETVFAYEGRRVRACVLAPEGTTLRVYVRVQERPELGWLPWKGERPLQAGRLELCIRNPRGDVSGSVRLRFDLQAPDGSATTVYSPDTFTALAGAGTCTPSETICCEGAPPARVPECPSADDATCGPDAAEQLDASPQSAEPARDADMAAVESGTCSVQPGRSESRKGKPSLLLAALASLLLRRRACRPGIPRRPPVA